MADEVTPNFKTEIAPCVCGCSVVARLVLKTFSDGTRHVRGCTCRQCRGRKSRRTGLEAQRRAAKSLGVPKVGPLRPGNEEDYAGLLRMENKSGAIVKPMWTAYLKAEAQSEASRPYGDVRPFVFCARLQPEAKEGLVTIRESKLAEAVYALAVQLGLIEE
jgi:hypothetical protein